MNCSGPKSVYRIGCTRSPCTRCGFGVRAESVVGSDETHGKSAGTSASRSVLPAGTSTVTEKDQSSRPLPSSSLLERQPSSSLNTLGRISPRSSPVPTEPAAAADDDGDGHGSEKLWVCKKLAVVANSDRYSCFTEPHKSASGRSPPAGAGPELSPPTLSAAGVKAVSARVYRSRTRSWLSRIIIDK